MIPEFRVCVKRHVNLHSSLELLRNCCGRCGRGAFGRHAGHGPGRRDHAQLPQVSNISLRPTSNVKADHYLWHAIIARRGRSPGELSVPSHKLDERAVQEYIRQAAACRFHVLLGQVAPEPAVKAQPIVATPVVFAVKPQIRQKRVEARRGLHFAHARPRVAELEEDHSAEAMGTHVPHFLRHV